jgi:diaminopimelate decarboxylase
MGGGFPAHGPQPKSRQTWNPEPIDVYIRTITEALRPFFPMAGQQPTLVVEPGRYLTCDGILLVTRVVHVKNRDGKQIVNCDGSISMVPLTHYSPQLIRVYSQELEERADGETPTILYGSTCRENDILYDGLFPATETGDYLVHFAAGAYNSSLSPDFIFPSPSMELF